VLTKHLSEASYSLYLLHHPIVMVMGIAFLGISMNIFVEYGIIVAAGFAIPYLAHRYLIAPWPLMSFLFNGKPFKRGTRAGRALT
jgi:glucans biosynthesis protein C